MSSSESIYSWIAPAPVAPERPPLYKARTAPDAPLAGSTLRKGTHAKGWGTLGAELKHTVRPDVFLRAHEATGRAESSRAAATKPFVRADATLRKSSVPKRPAPGATGGATATGGAGARPPKDFLTENAITAILASPRTKPPRGIPNALLRPGFAQRPKYLDRVAREMAAEREYVLDLLDAQQQAARASSGVGAAAREMSDDERAELLAALKAKWTEVSTRLGVRAHRKISTSGSTVGEIRSKENGERMLARLEADIKRLSVPSPIYVTDA